MLQNCPKNILLAGGESAGLQTLRLLADSPHRITAVLAEPSRDDRQPGLWNTAARMGLECIPAEQIRQPEFAAEVCEGDVDVLLNVHSLYLIPEPVLDACRIGAFNLHPGPLPEYAGLDVPGWALYHGESRHGVTLHHMVPQVDAGLIAYQARFDIGATDTGLTVMSRCVREGLPLIQSLLTDLYHDPSSIPRIPQDLKRRQYFFRRPPNDGWLNWHQPARRIENHIRAADYSPFPSPWGHPKSLCDSRAIGFVRANATELPTSDSPGTIGSVTDNGILVASDDFWVDVRFVEIDGVKLRASEALVPGSLLTQDRVSDTKAPAQSLPPAAARCQFR